MRFFNRKDSTSPQPTQDEADPLLTVDIVFKRFEDEPSEPVRRINYKAFAALFGFVVLSPVLYLVLTSVHDASLRRGALEQAEQFAKLGQFDQAATALELYLERWPEDLVGVEAKARIWTQGARNIDEVLVAAETQDLLLRLDPNSPGRQENRKKLVELYIRYSNAVKQFSLSKNIPLERVDTRARAAVNIAQQRLTFGADDHESHQLLAKAYDCLASSGDATALPEAALEYERALRRERRDVASTERLAQIYLELGKDISGSDDLLDELLKADPLSVEVRLARYRFFAKTNRLNQAQAEVDKATKLDPTNLSIRLMAAGEALQRRDPDLARRHLDAIPDSLQQDRRTRMFRGLVALSEQNPDVAIKEWRNGLRSSGGIDTDLNWQFAFVLLQLGRFAEAKPLIAQYRRLMGADDVMFQFLMGVWDEKTGRPWSAISKLESLRPSIDKAWISDFLLTLGHCYEKINDDQHASREYRRAIEASPRSLQPRQALARLLKKESADRAAQEMESAIELAPSDPSLYLDLAVIRIDQQLARPPSVRDWSKVNEVIERAKKHGRADPGLIKVQAEILVASGRTDEALSLLEKALEGPDRVRPDLWVFWSSKLVERNRFEEAIKVLERASSPEKAGDHATIRIAQARLLVLVGKARSARELLTKGVGMLPIPDQAALAKVRAEIFQALGDKVGAREACRDWARLAPEELYPGLTLLEMSWKNGDPESASLGLELLQKSGSAEEEPSAMAAEALDLLLSERSMSDTRMVRFDKAEQISEKLISVAPMLPITRLLRGMILEQNHRNLEAIGEYRAALDGATAEMALSRLIQLCTKLKRFEDLASLKNKAGITIAIDQIAANLAIEKGEKNQAERVVSRLGDDQPDNLEICVIKANLLRKLGKPKEAEQVLRALIDRGRNRPEPWVALMLFQADLGAKDEAAKTIERAAVEYKGEQPHLLTARLRWLAGDLAAATRLYEEAIARDPEDPTTLLAACNFAEATNRPDREEALARRALKVASCSAWASRRLAVLLSRHADPAAWSEAWALVSPGGPASGDTPNDRFLRASLLEISPDPARRAEMMTALTSLVEDLPGSDPIAIRAEVKLATTLLDAGKPLEAARFIIPATAEKITTDPATLALAIEVLARAGKPAEAEQRLSRLATAEPDSPRTASSRAWVFHAQGKPSDAIATIEEAASSTEKAPDGVTTHALFFNQYLRMKQVEAAERLARKMARLWPRNSWILAGFLNSQGRTDEALEASRVAAEAGATWEPLKLVVNLVMNDRLDPSQAIQAGLIAESIVDGKPKDIDLLTLASTIAIRQGRFEDALKTYRWALEISPSNPICLNDMAWLLCEELGRPADALVEIDKVFKAKTSASAKDTRGVILTRLGRFDEAIKELEQCVGDEPSAGRLLHLARAYQKAGKDDLYRSTLDRAKKAGIKPAALSLKERAEFAPMIGP